MTNEQLEGWAAKQAQELITLVDNLWKNKDLANLVKMRVLAIEAHGAMRHADQVKMQRGAYS